MLRRGPRVRRRLVIETPSTFRYRTPDFSTLASLRGLLTRRPLVKALLPLALMLCGGTLAFIRALLAIVSRLLALIRDAISLVGDTFSFVRHVLSPRELILAPPERRVAAVRIGRPLGVGVFFTDHSATLTLRG